MLNGLDLFSGIGGLTVALRDWVRPVAYCEIDAYCQAVLVSRMHTGELPRAKIWDDVKTFSAIWAGSDAIDIIYGGFPCQDISLAGNGAGLAGQRSGLFFEVVRLCSDLRPKFVFLENVPGLLVRGGRDVVGAFTSMGYDVRWGIISAESVGALHRRKRFFLLAFMADADGRGQQEHCREESVEEAPEATYNDGGVTGEQASESAVSEYDGREAWREPAGQHWPYKSRGDWQEAVNSVCRTSDGLPRHVDRLRGLGNAVVPQQARQAFKLLMGLKDG